MVMTPPFLQCCVAEARAGKSAEAGEKRRNAKHLSWTVVIPRSVNVFTVWQVYSVSLLLHALFVCCFVFCLFNDFGSCGPDSLSRRLGWEILHSQQRFLALFSFVFFNLLSENKTEKHLIGHGHGTPLCVKEPC